MMGNQMRQYIGEIESGYYGGSTVNISKNAMDAYNLEASRDLPPLTREEIDAYRARYGIDPLPVYERKVDSGERHRRSDRPAPSEPFKDEVSANVNIGQHYKFSYKGIKLDPYRILAVYSITNPMQQHIIKKGLRAGQSVKDLRQDIREIIATGQRWLEMLDEDAA
jgi:hypothetical protein